MAHSHIVMLVDVSGSMRKIDYAAAQGFNTFVQEQAEVPGTATVRYIRFNTARRIAYDGPIQRLPLVSTLDPNGGTAFYDALIDTIHEEVRPGNHREADYKIFVVLTDGEDLNSRHSRDHARTAVLRAREHGWQFVFLGANIDAEEEAQLLGIDVQFAYQFTATDEGTRDVYTQASAATKAMRSWGL